MENSVMGAFLAGLNPGLIVIAAGFVVAFVRGAPARAAILVGGPMLAFVALTFAGASGADLAPASLFGMELSLYRIDSLSFVFSLAFLIAAALGGIYSLHREDPMQDAAGMIYAGAAIGACLAGDLITLFFYWELTALASVLLILARRTRESYEASIRYLIIQLVSGLLLLAGALQIHEATGSVKFDAIASSGLQPLVGVIDINLPGAWLVLAAFGIKAAFPLVHSWLQDSYPQATETGAVVLSAFTTKLAVYALARCFAGLDILIWIGAIMTVFPVFFAVIENDLRKVLAYSLNNQVGFMVCAIGVGGHLAINGAAAHAFAHIIYKSLLFMTMGAVLLRTGTTKATELGGLHRTMPYTALFCIVGAVSISALPFFSGFAAKSLTMSAVQEHHLTAIWLMLLFASAGVLEHSGIKIPYFAFFGHDSGLRPKEAPFNMLLAMGIAAAICLGVGVAPGWLYGILPYRDEALEYLRHDLWTSSHLITQFQLLAFAALAFIVLQNRGLYPAERPGLILDAEWLWRRAAPAVVRWIGRMLSALSAWAGGIREKLGEGVGAAARGMLAPAGYFSRKVPLAATAVWTAGILALVLLISFFATR
ncbi:MAG: Na(+)/H(+) antiporter subunit D [Hyphomonadaceae bacterium]